MAIKFSVISPSATYNLARSGASADEGSSFTITLTTTGVQDGQPIDYTITGIEQADLVSGSLSGSFVVHGGIAVQQFTVATDAVIDPNEIFTLTLNNQPSTTVSVTINDTTVADSLWNNVTVLLKFDESVGSTSGFIDVKSGTPISQTTGGSNPIIVSNKKYGAGALKCDGANNTASNRIYITQQQATDMLSASAWCIDTWVYVPYGGGGQVFHWADYSNHGMVINWAGGFGGSSNVAMHNGTSYYQTSENFFNSRAVYTDNWAHLAVYRIGGGIWTAVNGQVALAFNAGVHTTFPSGFLPVVGGSCQSATGSHLILDNFRITTGSSRFGTSNFTPPTEASY